VATTPTADGTATIVLAKKAYDAGNFGTSEESLSTVLREAPDNVDALRAMALAQAAQGKNEEAIAQYAKIVAALPNDHASWYRMALLERVVGDSANAKTHLEKALALVPDNAGYADELAQTEMSLGRYSAAAKIWGGLLKRDGLAREARKELLVLQGGAYQAAGEYARARKAFSSAVKLDPDDKDLRERVASIE